VWDAAWYKSSFGASSVSDSDRRRRSSISSNGSTRKGTTSGSGAGRTSKQTIAKRDDEIALQKLRSVIQDQTAKVGSGDSASTDDLVGGKYGHLSIAFMRKYSLGHKFRKEKKEYDRMIGSFDMEEGDNIGSALGATHTGDTDTDDIDMGVGGFGMDGDSNINSRRRKSNKATTKTSATDTAIIQDEEDWVVMAFTEEESSTSLPFTTILRTTNHDTDTDNDDYDNDDELHHYHRRMAILLEAAKSSRIENHYPNVISTSSKSSQRKIQDDDYNESGNEEEEEEENGGGGGSVWKRLRAVSATNYMPSRILGAYPGDAVPIEDAGDANGVLELARRYGYGEWSDDDDDDDDDDDSDDDFGVTKRKKRKRKRRRSNKKRKRRGTHTDSIESYEGRNIVSDDSGGDFDMGVGMGIGGERRKTRGRKRQHNKTSRERSPPQFSFSVGVGSSKSFGTNQNVSTRRHGRTHQRRTRRVIIDSKSDQDDRVTKVGEAVFQPSIRRTRNNRTGIGKVRLPMERTNELNSSMSNMGKAKKRSGDSIANSTHRDDKRIQGTLRPRVDQSTALYGPMKRTEATFHRDKKDN